MFAVKLELVKLKLLKWFIFLGPLGNLFTPQLISHSFRSYYFCLLGFPIFYFSLQSSRLKLALYSIPFFCYCFFSSLLIQMNEGENFPLFRFFLLMFQFLFVLGASSLMRSYCQVVQLIFVYIKAFFFSLLIGYAFYIAFQLHLVSLFFLEYFSVLTQFGYGILRFSPGSYPNEYGIVCSFVLSILTWMLLEYENDEIRLKFSKNFLSLFYLLAFVALLLTTTRTAYISYLSILCYMAWKKKRLGRVLILTTLCFLAIALVMRKFEIDILSALAAGFGTGIIESGSLIDRFIGWNHAYESFREHPVLGNGFSVNSNLHNLYLLLLFELGIAGMIILFSVLLFFLFERGYLRFQRNKFKDWTFAERFLQTITFSGVFHVLWFASSNHNLNHHLTWLVAFLCFSLSICRRRVISEHNLQRV